MATDPEKRCFLCSAQGKIKKHPESRRLLVHNCDCGEYLIGFQDKSTHFAKASEDLGKLSALIKEQTLKKLAPYYLQWHDQDHEYPKIDNTFPVDVPTLLKTQWPRDVPEVIDRSLGVLAMMSSEGGMEVEIGVHDSFHQRLFFSRSHKEASYIRDALEEYKYIRKSGDWSKIMVLPKGWERFRKLTRGASNPENPAFVAMWFTAEMKRIYDSTIARTVKEAGYHVTTAELTKHDDFIMNKVIGLIRAAPFVVADFTGNRHGVYFEAGFARGLKIPVIHTCKKKDFAKAHFDIRQINTVQWSNRSELHEKLLAQIRGLVGQGPFPQD